MISSPGQRPPYPGTAGFHHAPNAALLIDFDNVTMGIRSDLGKELKSLLNSEVIRGKVAVQRAYADWRRYPQYIVPLAESSIDLIFAPAYGSSKKNATDLRMAIDAIELVFTRPEIGTFILMTGDSDFSSCVLKLKEYGKYVIGVGMRESSSDLLIQNCDEYYSYHSLSGLTRTGEVQESTEDPWVLVRRAAQQMEANGDVMRTDRLKQVMLDLDPAFDEKKIGYSKFSRFVQEAASKGVVRLRKGENGQYELVTGEADAAPEAEAGAATEPRRGRGRDRDRDREGRRDGRRESRAARPETEESPAAETLLEQPAEAKPVEAVEPPAEVAVAAEQRGTPVVAEDGTGIDQAYSLLQAAVRELTGGAGKSVRDGDVKRRMLDLSPGFDEADLGFSKFTRFLRQAHDAEVIDLQRANGGNYEVALPASGKRLPPPSGAVATAAREAPATGAAAPAPPREEKAEPRRGEREERRPAATAASAAPAAETGAAAAAQATVAAPTAAASSGATRSAGASGVGALRGRRGGRPGGAEGPPPILPGQAVGRAAPPVAATPAAGAAAATEQPAPAGRAAAAAAAPAEAEAAGAEEARKKSRRGRRGRGKGRGAEAEAGGAASEETAAAAAPAAPSEEKPAAEPRRPAVPEGPIDKITARARRGRALRGDADAAVGAPPILAGQAVTPPVVTAPAEPTAAPAEEAPARGRARGRGRKGADRAAEKPATKPATTGRAAAASAPARPAAAPADGPRGSEAVIQHLTSSFKGVGQKTAESIYGAFGDRSLEVLRKEPASVRKLLGDRRANALLEQVGAEEEKPTPPASRGRGRAAAAAPKEKKAPAKAGRTEGRGRGGGRGRAKKDTAPST